MQLYLQAFWLSPGLLPVLPSFEATTKLSGTLPLKTASLPLPLSWPSFSVSSAEILTQARYYLLYTLAHVSYSRLSMEKETIENLLKILKLKGRGVTHSFNRRLHIVCNDCMQKNLPKSLIHQRAMNCVQ